MSNIVLVGAGGTGISSLGFLLIDLGYTNIIGIDGTQGQITEALQKQGVHMYFEHGTYPVQSGDIIVYSDACPNAPEVLSAKKLHDENIKGAQIPYSYFQFIGEISKYFQTIAIAGTHGKSTTTAIATYTLSQYDTHFALGILGALVPQLDQKNYRSNPTLNSELKTIFSYILIGSKTGRDESLRKKYRFVIEADEFNRHFLYLDVDYAIILNAELDHSDIYPNEQIYLDTFIQFMYAVKKQIFVLAGEKGIEYLTQHGPSTITPVQQKIISLPHVFGDHIQKNISLLIALIDTLGITNYDISGFRGLWRRMELLKELNSGALLYTDYGHHPTEINAVYQAMKLKYTDKKLIAIFQPHQARRVLQFRGEFASTMQQFDEAIIYDIYAARENISELLQTYPLPNVHHAISNNASAISKEIEKPSTPDITTLGNLFADACNAIYTTSFSDITTRIEESQQDEVLCIFTAGNLDFQLRERIKD